MEITFNHEDIRPLIQQVVGEVLQQTQADNAKFAGRLAMNEPEAAAALGIAATALRDSRYRGQIVASKAGARIVYEVSELKRFLQQQRQN